MKIEYIDLFDAKWYYPLPHYDYWKQMDNKVSKNLIDKFSDIDFKVSRISMDNRTYTFLLETTEIVSSLIYDNEVMDGVLMKGLFLGVIPIGIDPDIEIDERNFFERTFILYDEKINKKLKIIYNRDKTRIRDDKINSII